MSNSCCVPDVYNSLIEDPKYNLMDAPLEGAGCFMGSCCVSHPQCGLGDVDKTRTFEFHPVENEREMEFLIYHHEYMYFVKNPFKGVEMTCRYGIPKQDLF